MKSLPVTSEVSLPGFPNGLPVIDQPRVKFGAGRCLPGGGPTAKVALSWEGIVTPLGTARYLSCGAHPSLSPRERWHGASRDGEGMKTLPMISEAASPGTALPTDN